MPDTDLQREKIEGGFTLGYEQLTAMFPEAKGVPQVQYDLKCANAVVLKRFAPGDIVCEEGEFGSTAFYLVKGKVNVFISSRAGAGEEKPGFLSRIFGGPKVGARPGVQSMVRKFISTDSGDLSLENPIAALGSGELFGEMTCRNFQPRSATIQATEECEVIEMLRVFLDLLMGQTDREPEVEFNTTPAQPLVPKDESPAPVGPDGKPLPPPAGEKPHKRREPKERKPGAVWKSGWWRWDGDKNQFAWRDGGWEAPPANHFWLGGAWVRRDQEWIEVEGRWQPFILVNPPPEPKAEEPPAAPSAEHLWKAGEWVWQAVDPTQTSASDNFKWVPGRWDKPKAKGAAWVPAEWEVIGENDGYRYVPGREVSPFQVRMNETYRARSLVSHLKSVELFAKVDPAALDGVVERATFKSCYPGERICEQGDPAEHFYLIRSGMVKVVSGFTHLVKTRTEAQRHARRTIMEVAKLDFQLQQSADENEYASTATRKADLERNAADAQVRLRQAADEEAASVSTYLRRGDYFGEMGLVGGAFPEFEDLKKPRRTATCIALDRVELVVIAREDFLALLEASTVFRDEIRLTVQARLSKQRLQKAVMQGVSTSFFEEKLFQAQNLLVIDLDKCTRCDQCVRACADAHDGHAVLHPVTKLVRDGRRFENYLVTGACRSCFDPLCMTRCPVSSIRRKENLEIIIEDWCIGCRACFEDCPFGNINMIDQFELSPSNVELVQGGPPAELTLSGVRVDRVKEIIVTVKGAKGGERAKGIEASLGGGKQERKILVRATGGELPDAKAKIAMVLRLKDGSIVDFPSGSGGIKVKAAGEKAEIKAGSKAVKVKASTCDLCTGLEMPSCVYACPHDAAMRVYPAEFFANGAPFEVKRQGPQPGDIDRRTTHIRLR
ncbi:MAG: cyclic nucleotide-binding domain-containing protein [Chthoniobacteraceae bacterium]